MSEHTLNTELRLVDDKVKMNASAPGKPDITTDYFPPLGCGDGYTPLELILVSYSSCLSVTLLTVLRHRMKKHVVALSAWAEGTQREEMPRILTGIQVKIEIEANDLSDDEIRVALEGVQKICPVQNMIRDDIPIDISVRCNPPKG